LHGIAAAHAAGMRCCAIPTSYKTDQLAKADLVIDSFVGLELQQLEKLFV
jgi:beta-phosphoglucomutase-like phosphatase (HAD superfamily)